MSELRIITNNRARLTLTWEELTDKERAEFDYISYPPSASFIRYRGACYDLGDFMPTPAVSESNPQMRDAGFHKWDGYVGDSFFSGVLVRYCKDYEHVVMGRYYQ